MLPLDQRTGGKLRVLAVNVYFWPESFGGSTIVAEEMARRPAPRDAPTAFAVADLRMDLLSRRVTRGGTRIDLQPREFQILEYLMRNAGRLVTRTMLLEGVWDFHFDPTTNIVESHISRLRGKVDRDFGPELIHTVRGSGYCLREPD